MIVLFGKDSASHHVQGARGRGTSAWFAAVALALFCPLSDAAVPGILVGKDSPVRVEGQYIVVLNDEAVREHGALARIASVEQAVVSLGTQVAQAHGATLGAHYSHVFRGFVLIADSDKVAEAVAADPSVEFVQVDQLAEMSTLQTPAPWGLDRIDQRYLPLSNGYSYTPTGAGVHVYVVDSGVRASHVDLSSRKAGVVGPGFTAISDGNGTSDCNGHGTHVAGTIGGSTHGVAKRVNLYPVRIFGCVGGSPYSTVILGLDWVSANAQFPGVVNMSLGGPPDAAFETAVSGLLGQGLSVVVAAGNAGDNACLYSPARMSASTSVITVGNSTSADARNPGSNWGSCVDLFAPGTDIASIWHTSDTATQWLTGTSMASPHVAGAAALYLQGNPGASPATVKSAILYAATANVISNTAVSPNRLLYTGFGEPGGTPITTGVAPGAPSNLDAVCLSGTLKDLTWNAASGDVGKYELYHSNTASVSTSSSLVWIGWDTSVLTSTAGWYAVRACNGAGCSALSNTRRVIIAPGTLCP